jgi:cellulose synthase operon protein C
MPDPSTPPLAADVRRLRLGDIEIDPRYRSVHRGSEVQELNPRCFALLMLFVLEPRVLHTREAIFRKVWRGGVVEDASLTTNIWMLRRALGGNARQWLRTVSRQGYIFDPPESMAIELVRGDPFPEPDTTPAAETPAPDADLAAAAPNKTSPDKTAPAAPEPDTATPPPPTVTPGAAAPPSRRGKRLLAAMLALLALLSAASLWPWRSDNVAPPRIVLLASIQADLPQQSYWPARLLSAWLDWQLRATPGLSVGAADDAGAQADTGTVLLISAGQIVESGDWRIAVRLRGAGRPLDLERQASAAGLVDAIDDISRETLAALSGGRPQGMPALQLPPALAEDLLRALVAENDRRWSEAVSLYSALLQQQPDLGFVRFRLARGLARLGQAHAAQAELALAGTWIDSLPTHLGDALRAEALLLGQHHAEAAAAYAALRQHGGDSNPAWRIAEASSLRQAGRSREAAERLAGALPAAPVQALDWLAERAVTETANREFRSAQASAALAMQLAQRLGWQQEHAAAALLRADANNALGEKEPKRTYIQAAHDFDAGADRQNQLRAQLYADLSEGRPAAALGTLDLLLAQARAAGNARLEIDSLRRFATVCYEAGDMEQAALRLAQAAGVAELANDPAERTNIDLQLIQLDTLRLDFAALDQRLAGLRQQPQQGFLAFRVGINAARLHFFRGQFDQALATLDNADAALRDASQSRPEATSTLDCLRGAVHIARGRIADAHNALRSCRSVTAYRNLADAGDAELALYSGAAEEARRLLAPMRDALLQPRGMSRLAAWGLALEAVAPLARSGDYASALQIADVIVPQVQAAGHRMIEADLRITRAEIALAQGRVDAAAQDVQRAEALVPADFWHERRRIRTIRALLEQAAGHTAAAARTLDELHNDTRKQGDVLGELLVHSLMDANPVTARCPDERRLRLLAESGMRAASDLWMFPAGAGRPRLSGAPPAGGAWPPD